MLKLNSLKCKINFLSMPNALGHENAKRMPCSGDGVKNVKIMPKYRQICQKCQNAKEVLKMPDFSKFDIVMPGLATLTKSTTRSEEHTSELQSQ